MARRKKTIIECYLPAVVDNGLIGCPVTMATVARRRTMEKDR